nr:hypothetical protein [Tanacetum cinerariifolium]
MTESPKSQPKQTYEEDLDSEIVMVKMPSCMSFLGCKNVYDEPICNLDKMGDEVENPSPQSTPQVLPSFEEYTPPLTYLKEVKETLGTSMEVEPLDQTKLEDVDDLKKQYGFKPGLIGQGGSLGVDLSNWEVLFQLFFCLKINHGGAFTLPPKIRYKGGYKKPSFDYYYKEPNNDLDNRLKKLSSDQDELQMLKYVEKYKVIDLYVDHSLTKETVNVDESLLVNELDNDLFIENEMLGDNDEDVIEDVSKDEWLQKSLRLVGIKKKHAVKNDNVRGQSSRNESINVKDDKDDGSNSDDGSASNDDSDSQDSDFLVDPDNMIDDVGVDIAEFRSNINANVEWVGSKAIVIMEEEEFKEVEVNHDELDSGSDFEYEGERKKALKMYHKIKKANASNAKSGGTTWKENFYVGLKFSNSKEIKEMVTIVAVEQRRELHLKKNDKVRVRCICQGKVPQFGCEDGDDDSGSKGVVSSGSKGNGQSKENGQLSESKGKSNNKTKAYGESIKPNPKIPLNALKDQLQKQYEVGISKQKVFRAKKMAQERVEGNHTRQYAQLRDYCLKLKNNNPNTTIKIEVEPPEDINNTERKFKRIYVCLGPLKDGFKAGKRDLLRLDGCFF